MNNVFHVAVIVYPSQQCQLVSYHIDILIFQCILGRTGNHCMSSSSSVVVVVAIFKIFIFSVPWNLSSVTHICLPFQPILLTYVFINSLTILRRWDKFECPIKLQNMICSCPIDNSLLLLNDKKVHLTEFELINCTTGEFILMKIIHWIFPQWNWPLKLSLYMGSIQ